MTQPEQQPAELPFNPFNPLIGPVPIGYAAGIVRAPDGTALAAVTLRGPHGEFTAMLDADGLSGLIRGLKELHQQLRVPGLALPTSSPLIVPSR